MTHKLKLNLNYSNIPIIGKYYLQDDVSSEFGPQFRFLLSAKESYSNDQKDDSYNSHKYNKNITNFVKKFKLGFNIGTGYDLNEKYRSISDKLRIVKYFYRGIRWRNIRYKK